MLPQKIGMLDLGERSECADLGALFGLPDPFEFGDVTDIEYVLRLEELLLHGRNKIGATGHNTCGAGGLARVPAAFAQQ